MMLEKLLVNSEQNILLGLILSVLLMLAMSLFLVWLNTERRQLDYTVRSLQKSIEAKVELQDKLSVERDYLLSPQYLGKKAATLGLYTALPGQIRRIEIEETNQ